MKLNDWTLPSELDKALKEHEVKENYSSFNLICNLLEEYLYDKGYYRINVSDDLTLKTQQTEDDSKDDGFKMIKQGKNIRLYYGDLDFSSHAPELIEEIKEKLLASDKPLEELSKSHIKVDNHSYKSVLYSILGISLGNLCIYQRKDSSLYEVQKTVKGKIYRFGAYPTIELAKKVRDFLITVSWNPKYSTFKTGLKGKNYHEFIFSKIDEENERVDKNGVSTTKQ